MTTSSENVGLSKGLRVLATLVRLAPAACDELANGSGLSLLEAAAILQLLQSEDYASTLPGTELLVPSALALQIVGGREAGASAARVAAGPRIVRTRTAGTEIDGASCAQPRLH